MQATCSQRHKQEIVIQTTRIERIVTNMKKLSGVFALATGFVALTNIANAAVIAFQAATPVSGNISGTTAATGLDFSVTPFTIQVTALGFYDSGQDGFVGTNRVTIYNRDTKAAVATATFAPGTGATLNGAYRFITFGAPVTLAAGNYSVIGENLFNSNVTLIDTWGADFAGQPVFDDGSSMTPDNTPAITTTNHWRFYSKTGPDSAPGVFIDSAFQMANGGTFLEGDTASPRFLSGTFEYTPLPEPGTYAMLAGMLVTGAGFALRARSRKRK